MSAQLAQAAQAVIDRWDSPQWEWTKHGPTADLIADLRKELAAFEAAPQQELVGYVAAIEEGKALMLPRPSLDTEGLVPVYAAPQQAQAPDQIDAERYRVLRDHWFTFSPVIHPPFKPESHYLPHGLDAVCDEMRAALKAAPQQGSKS